MTIARFAVDGAVLPPGLVVVLDEVSQVATAGAEVVLAAVAGGLGAELAASAKKAASPRLS